MGKKGAQLQTQLLCLLTVHYDLILVNLEAIELREIRDSDRVPWHIDNSAGVFVASVVREVSRPGSQLFDKALPRCRGRAYLFDFLTDLMTLPGLLVFVLHGELGAYKHSVLDFAGHIGRYM
jgi:hypothetical protein